MGDSRAVFSNWWSSRFWLVLTGLLCFIYNNKVSSNRDHEPEVNNYLRHQYQVYSEEYSGCHQDQLVIYRVIMHTFWSKELFPKHYPELQKGFRPSASFSKLLGRSHSRNAQPLFRIGEIASEGLKLFAENGNIDQIFEKVEEKGYIYDEFTASPSPPLGHTEAEFFVDGNHSKVSMISRIIPSPDWFVGLDSYDLCSNGRWIDRVTIEVGPYDAGTDDGLTFSAPNWRTEPRGVVSRILSQDPNHPASSFYYPDLEKLPSLAAFQFLKVKEYELHRSFSHPEISISSNNLIDQEVYPKDFLGDLKKSAVIESSKKMQQQQQTLPFYPALSLHHLNQLSSQNQIEKKARKPAETIKKRKPLKKMRLPRDCIVSEWTQWSDCSSTCGLGEITRKREIISLPKRGGYPCPVLEEKKWCGSARNCYRNYFNWS